MIKRRMHILLFSFLLCLAGAVISYQGIHTSTPHTTHHGFEARDMIAYLPSKIEREKYEYKQSNQVVNYHNNWFVPVYLDRIPISYTKLKLTSLGYYYITAYSPQETGSWQTASGITLHRADYENRYTEPTTCAIDRRLHRFGDLFYIREFDRVFVAEDTGGAVKNKHLDLGYTDLESVWSFPTGYYEVYSVEYEEITIQSGDYNIRKFKYLEGEIYDEYNRSHHRDGILD